MLKFNKNIARDKYADFFGIEQSDLKDKSMNEMISDSIQQVKATAEQPPDNSNILYEVIDHDKYKMEYFQKMLIRFEEFPIGTVKSLSELIISPLAKQPIPETIMDSNCNIWKIKT